MPELNATKLLIMVAIVALLFGSKKLIEMSRTLGQSVQELREGLSEETTQITPSSPQKSVL